MSRISWAVALAALVLSAVGCGGGEPTVATANQAPSPSTTTSTTAATDPRDQPLRWVRCIRAEGVRIDDPAPDGGLKIPPQTQRDGAFERAYEKCRGLLPGGAEPGPQQADPAQLEKLRDYAVCMRKNGVTSFPDPGAEATESDLRANPAYEGAHRACAQIIGANPELPADGGADG